MRADLIAPGYPANVRVGTTPAEPDNTSDCLREDGGFALREDGGKELRE